MVSPGGESSIFLPGRDAIEEGLSTAPIALNNKILRCLRYGGDSKASRAVAGPLAPRAVGHDGGVLPSRAPFANPSIPSCASNPALKLA
jgi:hypothetical protein